MIPLDIPERSIFLRLLRETDAVALTDAYVRNREHLARWEPARTDDFFTVEAAQARIQTSIEQYSTRAAVPWLLIERCTGDEHEPERERIVGTMTVNRITWGPFLSGSLGYWVDRELTGRGVATAAVGHVCEAARASGLHRIDASTLLDNVGSQTVLRRSGFEQFGLAPRYLSIAGRWQDHLLFQRILHDED
ncbi:GNAT family N-acetyltransferase [Leifsonia flava]|uniref:GNAT family N-acetyltransferase n=1 Tax=Orlajensenia leifsoniae TaxID=2561933 RepID=UPI001EFF7F58|nr:GNAT family N-acetyltransferase [Leifsonia flava]